MPIAIHPVVSSSQISGYGWIEDRHGVRTGLLVIEFKDGVRYAYRGVPERLFEEFLCAESKGSFFHANVRGKFETYVVDSDDRMMEIQSKKNNADF